MSEFLYFGARKTKEYNELKEKYNRLEKNNKEMGKFFDDMYDLWRDIKNKILEDGYVLTIDFDEKVTKFDKNFNALKKAFDEDKKINKKSVMNNKYDNKFMKELKAL